MSDQDQGEKPAGSKTKKARPTGFAAEKMQEAFIAHYVAQGFQDATGAAKLAGYSEKNAHVQASRLLKQSKVQERIDRYCRRQLKRTDRLALKTLELIQDQAESDITDVIEFDDNGVRIPKASSQLPKRVTRNIRSVRITRTTNAAGQVTVTHDITMHGVDKAKELLANITGLTRTGEPSSGADPEGGSESTLDRTERLMQITARLKASAKIAKKAKKPSQE